MFSPYPNPKLGHSNWDQLKEIDVLASTRELFIPAISSIIEKADGHCKFNKDTVLIFLVDTVLIFLKEVVKDNASCMCDPVYQIYVTEEGEVYNVIKDIQSEIGRKGSSKGGKAKAKATQDTRYREFEHLIC